MVRGKERSRISPTLDILITMLYKSTPKTVDTSELVSWTSHGFFKFFFLIPSKKRNR
jgi:hypothetical protein